MSRSSGRSASAELAGPAPGHQLAASPARGLPEPSGELRLGRDRGADDGVRVVRPLHRRALAEGAGQVLQLLDRVGAVDPVEAHDAGADPQEGVVRHPEQVDLAVPGGDRLVQRLLHRRRHQVELVLHQRPAGEHDDLGAPRSRCAWPRAPGASCRRWAGSGRRAASRRSSGRAGSPALREWLRIEVTGPRELDARAAVAGRLTRSPALTRPRGRVAHDPVDGGDLPDGGDDVAAEVVEVGHHLVAGHARPLGADQDRVDRHDRGQRPDLLDALVRRADEGLLGGHGTELAAQLAGVPGGQLIGGVGEQPLLGHRLEPVERRLGGGGRDDLPAQRVLHLGAAETLALVLVERHQPDHLRHLRLRGDRPAVAEPGRAAHAGVLHRADPDRRVRAAATGGCGCARPGRTRTGPRS